MFDTVWIVNQKELASKQDVYLILQIALGIAHDPLHSIFSGF